jgi:hypothetical protein
MTEEEIAAIAAKHRMTKFPNRASRNAGTSERQNAERKRAKTPNENAPKRRTVAKSAKR